MAVMTYDRLFRAVFSTPEACEELALNVLPPEQRRRLVPGSARMRKESFIDNKMQAHFSDLLVSFRSRESAGIYLYFLVDHKSIPDRRAPFQLLRYTLQVYDTLLFKPGGTATAGSPPEVLPLLFYHGNRQWSWPLNVEGFLNQQPGGEHLPRFTPFFCDMNRMDEAAFTGSFRTLAGLIFLKYIRRRFTADIACRLAEAAHNLPEGHGLCGSCLPPSAR